MPGADRRDEKFERVLRVQDRVVEEAADRVLRWMFQVDLRLGAHVMAVAEASGLIGKETAAVRQADLQPGMALEHAAEYQAHARNRGLERQPDEVLEIVGA